MGWMNHLPAGQFTDMVSFLEKLFSEGPFQFVFYISFIPVFLYLSFSTVFHFGLEKKVGAIELLAYGPVDGTSYFLAFYIKDVVLTILYLLVLVLFLSAAALLNNLVLDIWKPNSFILLM